MTCVFVSKPQEQRFSAMTTFEPINTELINIQDHRLSRECLKQLASHGDYHSFPFSWGFVVFRTVYTPGSDEAFAEDMDRLGVYAKGFAHEDVLPRLLPNKPSHDLAPNQDLWWRYFNVAVEDRASLADASVEEIGKRFDAWIKDNIKPDAKPRVPNSRYRYCLMIDQECIDNLLAMSQDPNISLQEDRQQLDRWVRLSPTRKNPRPAGSGYAWASADFCGICGLVRTIRTP